MNEETVRRIDRIMSYLREIEMVFSVKDRFWDLVNELDFSIMVGFIHCLYNVVSFGDNWWMTFGYTTEGQLRVIVEIFDLIEGWGFIVVEEAPLKAHDETHRWHIIRAENNT